MRIFEQQTEKNICLPISFDGTGRKKNEGKMSLSSKNKSENESENEIKNESQRAFIMLPEEILENGYLVLTGSKLKAYVEKHLEGIDGERDFVKKILKYCKSSWDEAYSITGLHSTGKTTGLLQAIRKLAAYEKCVYISFDRKTDGDLDTLQQLLDRLNDDHKYVFIDEITCMKDFANRICVLMDSYTSKGKRIVMSGTDSYAFQEVLSDGYWWCTIGHPSSISVMSYEEARRTAGMDFSSYLMSGGVYGTEKYKGTKGVWNYIKDSIVDNLVFSVRRNPIECSFTDMSEAELCQAVFLTMCIIVCSLEEDLQFDDLLDTISRKSDCLVNCQSYSKNRRKTERGNRQSDKRIRVKIRDYFSCVILFIM